MLRRYRGRIASTDSGIPLSSGVRARLLIGVQYRPAGFLWDAGSCCEVGGHFWVWLHGLSHFARVQDSRPELEQRLFL